MLGSFSAGSIRGATSRRCASASTDQCRPARLWWIVIAVVAHDPVEGAPDEVARVVPFAPGVAAVVLDQLDAEDAARAVELREHDEEERRPGIDDEERRGEPEREGHLGPVLPDELAPSGERLPARDAGEGVRPSHVGEMDQVQEVPAERDVLRRCPVGLAVVVDVVVNQVVRGDVGRSRVERAEAEHAAPEPVQPAAAEDALVEVVVDHHRVEEAQATCRGEERGIAASTIILARLKQR
ncbi:hypothetical protein WMF00_16605 [Sorangium sp. So ce1182]